MSTPQPVADPAFAQEVREGLTKQPKALPPRWLYDERGSALFEEITHLDEYYLTRRERAILQEHAPEILQACPGDGVDLVEFGAGSAVKTHLLLDAAIQRHGEVTYCPIDVSATAIQEAVQDLQDAFGDAVTVRPIVGDYEDGLAKLADAHETPRLILFIGSTIGTYDWPDQQAFLSRIASAMGPQDRFLLGTDLHKETALLEAAYDDAKGVTARFSLNLLERINRELGGHFDTATFAHRAHYNEKAHRIEVHLESLEAQRVPIDALDLEVPFEQGERIHTEYAYKYTRTMIQELRDAAGLRLQESWYDEDDWFGVHLVQLP